MWSIDKWWKSCSITQRAFAASWATKMRIMRRLTHIEPVMPWIEARPQLSGDIAGRRREC